jgi:hypothetical protein
VEKLTWGKWDLGSGKADLGKMGLVEWKKKLEVRKKGQEPGDKKQD